MNMKTAGRIKYLGLVLLCLAGIAGAVMISEPFDVFPNGGNDWSGDWGQATGSETIQTVALSSDSDLEGGDGSYMTYRTNTTGSATGVYRDFAGAVGSGIYTMVFNVRMDDLGDFYGGNSLTGERIQLRTETSTGTTSHGTNGGWLIMASPGLSNDNWYVYEGNVEAFPNGFNRANFVDSGIPVVEGKVYTMMVTAYPATRTYDVTIDDGTTIFTYTGAEYRSISTNPADRLVFSNNMRAGVPAIQMAVDSIHIFPGGVHDPLPADNAVQVPTTNVGLSWNTLLTYNPDPNDSGLIIDPNLTGHYVYFSAPNNPDLQAVTPVLVPADADSDGQPDAAASYTLPFALQKNAVYYWRVDESFGASGPNNDPNIIRNQAVWSFATETTAPDVWAGQNVVTWLENGTASVSIAANIDWFNPQSAIEWTVVSMPAGAPEGSIQLSNAAVEDPTVTISYAGKPYVLKLKAADAGGLFAEDTMQIDVYADSCIAAQNILGYQSKAGDLNRDCRVNLDDFQVLATDWLDADYLLENVLY